MEEKTSRIYMVDKALAAPKSACVRGVELFNIELVRDMVALGAHVTLLAHESWRDALSQPDERNATGSLQVIHPPRAFGNRSGLAMLWSNAILAGSRRDHVLLQGNVANSFCLGILMARWMRVASRAVLIAHRMPSRRVLWAQRALPSRIISVNGIIDSTFRRSGFKDTQVYYGVTRTERFHPRAVRERGAPLRIGVLGQLNTPWKGADTAMAAFRTLPDELRCGAELHLASYGSPPSVPETNIICHPWMPSERIPEFLRTLDILLVPSRDERVMRETFSQAAVQGMLTGLPIVVSDLPVLAEKVAEGGGLRAGSVSEFGIHLATLIRSEELRTRLGREAREVALRKYVWSTARFLELTGLS
jgi:glycosyltransferase involved in cell wall biosynthesis